MGEFGTSDIDRARKEPSNPKVRAGLAPGLRLSPGLEQAINEFGDLHDLMKLQGNPLSFRESIIAISMRGRLLKEI